MSEPKAGKKQDPIHKTTLADGRTRYWFRIDIGTGANGKRDQRMFTFDSLKEARNERAKIIAARSIGTYVAPTKATVAETIDTWLAGRRNLRPTTKLTYTDTLAHAKAHLGHVPIQKVTKADVDAMVSKLLTEGRRGPGRKKTLSARTVNAILDKLSAVFEDALKQGLIGRNVVKLVDRPRQTKKEMQTWTAEQAAAFLAFTAEDRLAAAWMLSLYGLRRGEVLGLRWSDINLAKKTLTVNWCRLAMGYEVVEGEPKTERGKRTLPLDDSLVSALTTLQLKQREEADKAGAAYQPACEICGGQHVIANEVGQPVHPEWYGQRFAGAVKAAKLPVIRLHDTRHTCGTLMHLRGVPTAVISKWLGHASASFTLATYVHSQDEALAGAGQTLAQAFAPEPEPAGQQKPAA